MKKSLKIALTSVLVAAGLAVTAGAANFEHCADQLKEVGLFQGTESGYELDRAPNRGEAAAMLVRLLGKEEEAQKLTYTAPFTDLAGWEKPYVQYLYENKLTDGTSDTTFSPRSSCSAQMYTTFLLRSLGYADGEQGDFTYAKALDFGKSIGLVDFANCNESKFLRDHVAAMSLTALHVDVKSEKGTSLLEKLVKDGAIEQSKASSLLLFFDRYDDYMKAASQMDQATKSDISMKIDAKASLDGQELLTLSMPVTMQADMDLEHMDQSKLSMTGTMKMHVNPELATEPDAQTDVELPIAYYYTNGVYYMNAGGQKVKMPMSFEDAMAQMGDLTSMQSEPLCLIEDIAVSGGKTTVTYSASGMEGLVDSILGSMGTDALTSDVQIRDIVAKATVSGSKVQAIDVAMKMDVTVDGQTMTMDMTVNGTVNALGSSVTVKFPTDLDTYTDIADVTPDTAA